MSDCRFGVSPVNYPDPDPGMFCKLSSQRKKIRHVYVRVYVRPGIVYIKS